VLPNAPTNNEDIHSRREIFPLNYTSAPGIGFRARQHFFPNQKDIQEIFTNRLTELDVAYMMRVAGLRELAVNQLPFIVSQEDAAIYDIDASKWTR